MSKWITQRIKGIAILLMLMHHFWGFSAWVLPENKKIVLLSIAGYDVEKIIGVGGKICVYIFAFLSGFALYYNQERYKSTLYRVKKILSLYLDYWSCLAIIIVIGAICREPLPHSTQQVLQAIFALNTGVQSYRTGVVGSTFAWYIAFYAEVLLSWGVLRKLLSKLNFSFFVDSAIVVLLIKMVTVALDVLGVLQIWTITQYFYYIQILIIGYLAAKYDVYDRVKRIFDGKKYAACVELFLIGISFCVQTIFNDFIGIPTNNVFTPIFVLCVADLLEKHFHGRIATLLDILSSYSMDIWLLHSIFFMPNRTIQFIAYAPHIGLLIIVWVAGLTILLSWCKNNCLSYLRRLRRTGRKDSKY